MPPPLVRSCAILVAVGAWIVPGAARAVDLAAAVAPARAEHRPVTIAITWGGGNPVAWSGSIEVVATDRGHARLPCAWRTLGTEPDAAAMVHDSAGAIIVRQTRPLADDGVEITVHQWWRARLVLRLGPSDGRQQPTTFEVAVADILAEPVQRPLDAAGNRLVVARPPADALLVAIEPSADGARRAEGTVQRPGERTRLRVEPLIPTRGRAHGAVELRLRLRPARQATELDVQGTALRPVVGDASGADSRVATAYEPVVFDVTLPESEGVYEVELEAVERGSLRWTKPLVSRSIEITAVAERAPERPPSAESVVWTTLYELDPGSPRLHERLRRLPGMSIPAVPLPTLPRAALPLPRLSAVPLPSVPLPNVPLPSVSMPNVAAMVPRLGGLLAVGDSTVVPHPLGPMLRLPPSRGSGEASWEGIVVASARPGMPHAVEIEYPDDQDAVIGVAVLETDAAGTVELRHAGGFEVAATRYGAGPAALGVHRFIFWPTTRHPLIVVANTSPRTAAAFGRVRVKVSESRLAAARAAAAPLASGGGRRRTFAYLDGATLAAEFGGPPRVAGPRGQSAPHPVGDFVAIRHSAEALVAEGAAGAVVEVRGGGAQGGFMDLLAKVYAREGLAVVPALAFDAPLPAVERALAGGEAAAGIACVGRDGQPRRLPGGSMHYNILDPRVQAAVEAVVVELAERLRGAPGVEMFAVVLPREGWLHLPGVAWGLDDETYRRFVASHPEVADPDGDGRHGERAKLVEGPLREAWLNWRCAEVAGFHARLAHRLAGVDDRWSLAIVPTTVTLGDEFVARARPALALPGIGDVGPEIGIDPSSPRGEIARRLVYVAPVVHSPRGDLRERASREVAGRALTFASAARRGVVIVEDPVVVDLAAAAAHGPTAGASPPPRARLRAACDSHRGLAEGLAAADAELVIDTGLGGGVTGHPARLAFDALPAVPLAAVPGVARPVHVRAAQAGGVTWVTAINAGAAPTTAVLVVGGPGAAAVDAVDGATLGAAIGSDGDREIPIPLGPWAVRSVILDGAVAVKGVRVEHGESVRRGIAARIESVRARRAALDSPAPLAVLDNPAFEIGAASSTATASVVSGWEVLEPRRGSLALVPAPGADGAGTRAVQFSSSNGLATLRSNPFGPPRTGRVSVAAWLRLPPGAQQPPLRIAIEAAQGADEYYRFAAVGGLTGGRPLTASWSQFVLQVDDVPADALDSMRVRFDLLGPGQVQIDDVRVFDLAFDDSQRAQLTKLVSLLGRDYEAGDIGSCIAALDGYWPRFLEAFVSDETPPAAAGDEASSAAAAVRQEQPRQAGGVLDRVRRWWQ